MNTLLTEKCAKQVARGLADGVLPLNTLQNLERDISDQIFEHLLLYKATDATPEHLKNIIDKLTVSKMNLDCSRFNETFCEMVRNQNLCRLELCNLEKAPIFHSEQVEVDGVLKTSIEFADALKKLLNTESRARLTKLSIDSGNLALTDGWVQRLHELLPNIEHLILEVGSMTPREFTSLCNLYPGLTTLEISGCRLTSLRGISNMSNLQVLAVPGIQISNVDDLIDIFELRELRVLNMGLYKKTDINMENMIHYLACNMVLPELRFIDCSNNYITIENLDRLVATHTKLETISLNETNLSNTPQTRYPNRKLNLLTTENLHLTLQSLRIYTASKKPPFGILDVFYRIINEFRTSTPFDEYKHQVLSTIFELMRKPDAERLLVSALGIFVEILDDSREVLTASEKHDLVTILLELTNCYWSENKPADANVECSKTLRHMIEVMIWGYLVKIGMTDSPTETVVRICEHAVKRVKKNSPDSLAFFIALKTLCIGLRKSSPSLGHQIDKDHSLKTHLCQIMNIRNIREMHDEHREITDIVSSALPVLIKFDTERFDHPDTILCHRKCIQKLLEMATNYNGDDKTQSVFFEQLEQIVKVVDVKALEGFICESDEVFKHVLTLLNNRSEARKALISVLLTLKNRLERAGQSRQSTRCFKLRVNAIMTVLEKYEKADEADDLAIVKWQASSKSKEASEWGRWFLKICGLEEAGPSAEKKRRVK